MSSSEPVIVTVEGSITPCVVVARGERRTVRFTPRIRRLIARGYLTVVAEVPPIIVGQGVDG